MLSFNSAQLDALLTGFFWPFMRLIALMLTAPVFAERALPQRVRIGLAVMITAVLMPTLPPPPAAHPLSLAGVVIIAQQLIIGAALGFAMRIVFVAVETAGEIVGLQMGLGYATLFDPERADMIPVLGQFLGFLTVLAFLALDGHLHMIEVLADTFRALPVSGPGLGRDGLMTLVQWGGEIFAAGVLLSLPLLGAMLIANVALGILTRAAPQLNLFAVGFPLTLGAGLVILAVALPL
ncbi:MAG TPA: flagellar biosynthetic protein FliR, partial [Burkholderiales bacterium]|nr:flagellar biosynthetic protein FliR [Burkholderiales bacterium]